MRENAQRASRKAGLPPGSVIHIGEKKSETVTMTVFEYNESECREYPLSSPDAYRPLAVQTMTTWINVDGLHQTDVIEAFGRLFHLHPLTLEDIAHAGQSPKIEDYRDYLFVVLKMHRHDENSDRIESEQISLCIFSDKVLTFQEEPERDLFDPIRQRIRTGKGKIRTMGADYLAYSLIDAIVDSYFIILEKIGERIRDLEERVIDEPSPELLHAIYALRRDLVFLRKSVWPLREVIKNMERGDSLLIRDSVHVYLRDVYDHTIRVIETIEAFRDIIAGILDIHLTSIGNRTNSVMKVLTIIATIFMPLTFIAGIYGMNFKYMPELEWRWGYPIILAGMISLGIGMLVFFKIKRWL